jgi:hypothetical protein
MQQGTSTSFAAHPYVGIGNAIRLARMPPWLRETLYPRLVELERVDREFVAPNFETDAEWVRQWLRRRGEESVSIGYVCLVPELTAIRTRSKV